MIELPAIKEAGRFVPLDPAAAEDLQRIANGTRGMVTWRQPRNVRAHRWMWALAQKVADSCDWLHDREEAMDLLKIKARHVRIVVDPRTGELHLIPKSISFAAMDEARATRLRDRFVYVVCADILPGIDEGALRREVEAMVGAEIEPAPAGRRAA